MKLEIIIDRRRRRIAASANVTLNQNIDKTKKNGTYLREWDLSVEGNRSKGENFQLRTWHERCLRLVVGGTAGPILNLTPFIWLQSF